MEDTGYDSTHSDVSQDSNDGYDGNQDNSGDAPSRAEWHDDRFDTVDDQAMAWVDANKKFGGFTGAPEDGYKFDLPDGFSMDEESKTISDLQEFGKKVNMDQGTMDGLIDIYMGEVQAGQTTEEGEMAKLGEHAVERLTSISNWVSKTDTDGSLKDFIDANTTTAEGVEVVEHFMKMINGESSVTRQDTDSSAAGDTLSDVQEAMDDPRYYEVGRVGDAYRQRTDKRMKRVFGEEE